MDGGRQIDGEESEGASVRLGELAGGDASLTVHMAQDYEKNLWKQSQQLQGESSWNTETSIGTGTTLA